MNSPNRFLLILLFIPFTLIGQKESYNWYFGIKAGITFNPNGNPVVLTNSVMTSGKGSATISDSCSGQLYFYTNGDSIINRNHVTMQNGKNLDGSSGSTQSAIIVPSPDGSSGDYYVFTVERSNGLKYSVVNMSLAGGMGAVVSNKKNIALVSPTVEKVTAVGHNNNKDVWLITHKVNTNEFYSYLLTSTGLNSNPVISSVGQNYGANSYLGYMKASPKGDKLALALAGDKRFDLFDFDNSTGSVSNPRSSGNIYNFAYGLEFSPDGSKLYVTSSQGLFQYNLNTSLPGKPLGDSTFLGSKPTVAIQLGPNGVIYCNEGYSLGAINEPNNAGVASNYVSGSVNLGSNFASSGLPTFMQSYFSPMYIVEDGICFGLATQFSLSSNRPLDSLSWDFGEPSSGSLNYSKLLKPSHQYNDTGQFVVNVLAYSHKCGVTRIDTVVKTVHIVDLPIPLVDLGNDTIICEGDSITLWTDGREPSYVWSTGSNESQINVGDEGGYWVKASNTCGSLTDSLVINYFVSNLNVDLGKDTLICKGDFMSLNVVQEDASYLWNTGSEHSEIFVKKAGKYWVRVNDLCYTQSDTLIVKSKEKPSVNLGKDTIICEGSVLVLDASYPGATYLWNGNSENPTYSISEEGSYRVRVSNDCGSISDDIYIRTEDCRCSVFIPNSFTPNKDGLNEELVTSNQCDFVEYNFEVYNRWGEVIFKTSSPDVFWDGYKNGQEVPSGIYYYTLTYISTDPFDSEEHQMRGVVSIIK